MSKALLAALLVAAAPALALAQATPNNSRVQPIPNETNLQGQANQAMQPLNAHPVERGPGLGQANAIPTPTFDHPMTKTDNGRAIPHSDPIR